MLETIAKPVTEPVINTSLPADEYERRLAARKAVVEASRSLEGWAGTARVASFLAIAPAAYLIWGPAQLSAAILLIPILALAASVVWHRRVLKQLGRAARAVRYYERGLERLAGRWSHVGSTGEEFLDHKHAYASDLDLFGRGSIFQWLCAARTQMGEATLAQWLKTPAAHAEIRARQAAAAELRMQVDLREELSLVDQAVGQKLRPQDLLAWVAGPAPLAAAWLPIVGTILGIAAFFALLAWGFTSLGFYPLAVVTIIEVLLMAKIGTEFKAVCEAVEKAQAELDLLGEVLAIVENRTFQAAQLVAIRDRLTHDQLVPSREIARLRGLVRNLDQMRHNQFFAPLAFIFMLLVHVVWAIERRRQRLAAHLPGWLQAAGEFEAILSVAGYAYEHPEDVQPELVEEGPLVEYRGVGHPLIAHAKCVRNDIALGDPLRLVLVSGSNMSGKSTLMRSVGCNIVLAWLGCPVRAQAMRLSELAIGTAMRVQDSLQEGTSHFYAEIKRLRAIMDLVGGAHPLLFLFDEILHGTNSHDRRVGAEGIIRKLVASGAIGLVTTHDLALAEIVESLGEKAANVHFEDQLVDGKMSFDYRMREGVVPRSNALALMRLLGLEV